MRAEDLLDSAVFQLTPTRTRCDLVIIANGKMEKIASGLLKPFLGHLKTAQNQIAKGGYSITLEPDSRANAVWLTKGTMERFVRFVSTPEVLERVSTIESEILQINKAISIQENGNLGLSVVEDHLRKPAECIEGSKLTFDANVEKAIILYKLETHATEPDSNGCIKQEENSKVNLLRVLESRKTVLQKEQGMAFARAAAAGFDMDHMAHLITFSECFGASRLMVACLQFMELWNRKYENGQWLETEAAEETSSRPDFFSLNASGVILSEYNRVQKELGEACQVSGVGTEINTKADNLINAELSSHGLNKDNNIDGHLANAQEPWGHHEYLEGQFQHSVLPRFQIHPPGPPIFQPYPVQEGMPYYQSYRGGGPYIQSPYHPTADPRFNNPIRPCLKRHSMDNMSRNIDSESPEMDVYKTKSLNGAEQNKSKFEEEDSVGHESLRRHAHSRKNESGAIKANYITSKGYETSGSESRSTYDSESKVETKDLHSNATEGQEKASSNNYGKDEVTYRQEADTRNWQEFQNCLLRAEEKTTTSPGNIFSGEKGAPIKRGQFESETDAILLTRRDPGTDFRTAIDMNSKSTLCLERIGKFSSRPKNQHSYEPDVLMLMPERGMYNVSTGYDPARDCAIPIPLKGTAKLGSRNQEVAQKNTKLGSKKLDKEKKSKVSQDVLEKRKKDSVMRKGISSKLNLSAEAQKRAENVRAFKADLQKLKKEKEEEDLKRLEALKKERQKRIAARSSSNTVQPPVTLKQNRAKLPPKLSPGLYKGSKFCDSEPVPSRPQILPIRTTSISSSDSRNITKLIRLNGSTNGLSRSVSSLPKLTKPNGFMPAKKASSVQSRRLSEPKTSASLKQVSNDKVPKKNTADEPQKKISAIMLLDKTKSATLPELKIRTPRAFSDAVERSGSSVTLQQRVGSKTSLTSESIQQKKSNEKLLRFQNIDDNPVVEKTVLVVENQEVPAASIHESIDMKKRSQREDRSAKTRMNSEYVGEVRYPSAQLDNQLHSPEVEEPATCSWQYAKQPHALISEMTAMGTKNKSRACVLNSVSSYSTEQFQEIPEKCYNKESKGFRKLLKFGRKSLYSDSGEANLDSDQSAVDDKLVSSSTSDAHTLKNLISQDIGGTPPKASCPYSLLSPFRSKTS